MTRSPSLLVSQIGSPRNEASEGVYTDLIVVGVVGVVVVVVVGGGGGVGGAGEVAGAGAVGVGAAVAAAIATSSAFPSQHGYVPFHLLFCLNKGTPKSERKQVWGLGTKHPANRTVRPSLECVCGVPSTL